MHLNFTYSNGGLWYYKEAGNIGILSGLVFGIYGSLNQAYMMGLLFFIAGYFVPRSFDNSISRSAISWYIDYLISFSFLSTSGPLWFTFALLIFSLIYTLLRQIFFCSKDDKCAKKSVHLKVRTISSVNRKIIKKIKFNFYFIIFVEK